MRADVVLSLIRRIEMGANVSESKIALALKELEELEEKAIAYDSQSVQDAIECDRIEKRLIELNKLVSITTNCIVGIGHSVIVGDYETGIHGECSRNKLEALAKALEWIEGESK